MKKVIIASKNPVKINAVQLAFNRMIKEEKFEFEGVTVHSGVSDQPCCNDETLCGATNRANNAKNEFPDADFWVGIEGGIEEIPGDNGMESFAWVVVESKTMKGKARSATFFLPKKVTELIKQGKELGDADDIVFGDSNSKQKNGAVGILTHNVITRKDYYVDAVIFALIPFKNLELY